MATILRHQQKTFLLFFVILIGYCFVINAATKSTISCDVCEAIVGFAGRTLENNATMALLAAWLATECVNLGPLEAECIVIEVALVDALHNFPHSISFLGYDTPTDVCSVLSICSVQCCLTNSSPEQVHIAYGTELNTMVVSWTTFESTSQSLVQFGLTDSGKMDQTANGITTTYSHGGWVGIVHSATLQALQSGASYSYRVGNDVDGWSVGFTFINRIPTRFAVVGDMGAGPNAKANIAALGALAEADKIDAVLHVGDISYANGIQRLWDDFMRQIEPVAARVPYMVLPGNHEIMWNFSAYKTRWFMPGGGVGQDASDRNMFWSYDFGDSYLHLVGSNTESPIDTLKLDEVQRTWLNEDLDIATRKKSKWIIWMGHRPLYCSSVSGGTADCTSDAANLRSWIETMLQGYHVDLVITGHVHNYERMLPVFGGNVTDLPSPNTSDFINPHAPIYIMNGAGGNREGPDPVRGPSEVPNWSFFRYSNWGYGLIELNEAGGTLDWSFHLASSGEVLDQFRILKQ